MAKFKSEHVINRAIPFPFGTVQGNDEGMFEVSDDEAVKFFESHPDFERLDAPKPQSKAPVSESKSKAADKQ